MRSGQRAAPIQLYSHAPTDTFLEEKLASPKILFGPDTAIVHKIGIIGNSGEREIGQNLRNWTGRSWMSLWMTTVFGLRVLSLFAFILSVNCSYSSAPLSWVLTVIKWWQSWRWWSKARRKLIMVMVMIMVMMVMMVMINMIQQFMKHQPDTSQKSAKKSTKRKVFWLISVVSCKYCKLLGGSAMV